MRVKTSKSLFFVLFLVSCVLGFAVANTVKPKITTIEGRINLDAEYVVYVADLVGKGNGEEFPIAQNGTFKVELEIDAPKWIEVTFTPIAKDRQLGATFPMLVKPGDTYNFTFSYAAETYLEVLSSKKGTDNIGLIEYAGFSNRTLRNLFMKPGTAKEQMETVTSYLTEANAIIEKHRIKQKDIVDYLRLWSMNNYLTAYSKEKPIPADIQKQIPALFDTDMTLSFYNGATNVNDFVTRLIAKEDDPIKLMENKMTKLNELFTNQQVIMAVISGSLHRYVTSYRIITPVLFQKDTDRLANLLNKIGDEGLKVSLLKDFKNLYSTTKGSSIPDVDFLDINGNVVKLDQFKGNYIYIDLWASWCVPCIKEIPYLQQLEKDFADKNITFISLSLDEDKVAWRKKVKELNLAGHQWELGKSEFDKLMNIRGIPHFVLYGPDGTLSMYQAPRPSSEEIRKIFNQL